MEEELDFFAHLSLSHGGDAVGAHQLVDILAGSVLDDLRLHGPCEGTRLLDLHPVGLVLVRAQV